METIQIVLDKKLLDAADQAARRTKRNRSALVRDALREHLPKLELRAKELRDREGYARVPVKDHEWQVWEAEAEWPAEQPEVTFACFPSLRQIRAGLCSLLVLTRESAIRYLSTVTVAAITSTIRGVPSEVILTQEDGMKRRCAVNLHNSITVFQQRLGTRVAQLSPPRMNKVCSALRFSLGCDALY